MDGFASGVLLSSHSKLVLVCALCNVQCSLSNHKVRMKKKKKLKHNYKTAPKKPMLTCFASAADVNPSKLGNKYIVQLRVTSDSSTSIVIDSTCNDITRSEPQI